MPIFKIEGEKLRKLSILPLGKERDLQRLVEKNLGEAMGLRFLASEYTTTSGGRIDTLAIDEAGAPVIIEYKRNRNDNVINQALSYLSWLKTQKREFFEKIILDRVGVETAGQIRLDWHSPWVICVAESYSKFDRDTAVVVPLRIELFRYRFYEDGVFSLEREGVPVDEIQRPSRPRDGVAAFDETGGPTVEGMLSKTTGLIREVFADLREWILSLDEAVVEKPTQEYIAYRITKNFAEVYVRRSQINIHLRETNYPDPHNMIEQIPESYNWTLNRRVYVRTQQDLERAQPIIEHSYRDVL